MSHPHVNITRGAKGSTAGAEVCFLPLLPLSRGQPHVWHGSYSALFIACYSHLVLIRGVLISSWAFLWYSSFWDECFTNANWSSACPLGDSMVGILPLQMRSWDSDWVKKKKKRQRISACQTCCAIAWLVVDIQMLPACRVDPAAAVSTWGSQCPEMSNGMSGSWGKFCSNSALDL